MPAPNFDLVTELQTLVRRDFVIGTVALLNPTNANPIIDGEWLELNSSYQLARGSGEGVALSYPVHTERGRYDTQALGKVNVLFAGMYEADIIVDSASYGSTAALGDALSVQSSTLLGVAARRGLIKAVAFGTFGTGAMVVGFVTKVYAGLNKVRMVHHGYMPKAITG